MPPIVPPVTVPPAGRQPGDSGAGLVTAGWARAASGPVNPRSMTELAIEATGLTKSFGETRALGGVDLAARRGTVHAVLGPNGAGKTTAIRILATLLRA